MSTRTTPSAIFTASPASEGAVFGLGGLLPVAATVIVTTIASDASHPNTYAAPFTVPRLDGRMTMNAVSGNGSKVTAKPISMRLRTIAIPLVSPGWCHGLRRITGAGALEPPTFLLTVPLTGQQSVIRCE